MSHRPLAFRVTEFCRAGQRLRRRFAEDNRWAVIAAKAENAAFTAFARVAAKIGDVQVSTGTATCVVPQRCQPLAVTYHGVKLKISPERGIDLTISRSLRR